MYFETYIRIWKKTHLRVLVFWTWNHYLLCETGRRWNIWIDFYRAYLYLLTNESTHWCFLISSKSHFGYFLFLLVISFVCNMTNIQHYSSTIYLRLVTQYNSSIMYLRLIPQYHLPSPLLTGTLLHWQWAESNIIFKTVVCLPSTVFMHINVHFVLWTCSVILVSKSLNPQEAMMRLLKLTPRQHRHVNSVSWRRWDSPGHCRSDRFVSCVNYESY